MNWTPATSISSRAAHPSRIRVLGGHRESFKVSPSPRKGSNAPPASVRPFSPPSTPPNPLDATLLSLLLCVASKELAQYLNHSNATLTKNAGGVRVSVALMLYPIFLPYPLSFHALVNSFAHFCIDQGLNSFVSNQFCTLRPKMRVPSVLAPSPRHLRSFSREAPFLA